MSMTLCHMTETMWYDSGNVNCHYWMWKVSM